MQFISGWIINMVVFILLAMIVDMLLPDTSIKKYVKLVTGLLLITIVVTPVFNLLSTDMDEAIASFTLSENSMKAPLQKIMDEKKREIETSSYAYTLEQMAVQLKESAEKEMIEHYGVTITRIHISGELTSDELPDSIQKLTVYIRSDAKENEISSVQPVSIDISKEDNDRRQPENDQGMKSLLASIWEVPESKIEIADEGRNR